MLILDWTDIRLDLNPFKRRDLKDKPYKWGYSRDSFSLRQLHCYAFEPVKKRCSFSVLLTGMTFEFGFRDNNHSEIIGVVR